MQDFSEHDQMVGSQWDAIESGKQLYDQPMVSGALDFEPGSWPEIGTF